MTLARTLPGYVVVADAPEFRKYSWRSCAAHTHPPTNITPTRIQRVKLSTTLSCTRVRKTNTRRHYSCRVENHQNTRKPAAPENSSSAHQVFGWFLGYSGLCIIFLYIKIKYVRIAAIKTCVFLCFACLNANESQPALKSARDSLDSGDDRSTLS